jgi:hypothetical protein
MSEPTWELLGGGGVVGGPIDYVGAWAAGTTYQPGQVVRYGGVDYLAVNPSLGQTPPVAAASSFGGARVELGVGGYGIPHAAWTAISWTIEVADDIGLFNPASPTRLTIPSSGWYSLTGGAEFVSSASGVARYLAVYLGGGPGVGQRLAVVAGTPIHAASAARAAVATNVYLTAAQYVELYAYQDSGATLNVQPGASAEFRSTFFSAVRL